MKMHFAMNFDFSFSWTNEYHPLPVSLCTPQPDTCGVLGVNNGPARIIAKAIDILGLSMQYL